MFSIADQWALAISGAWLLVGYLCLCVIGEARSTWNGQAYGRKG